MKAEQTTKLNLETANVKAGLGNADLKDNHLETCSKELDV